MKPKAMTFDIFGTVLDVIGSLSSDYARAIGRGAYQPEAPAEFAKAWAGGYSKHFTSNEWEPLMPVLYRTYSELEDGSFGLGGLDLAGRKWLRESWLRLKPHPDVEALATLRGRVMLSTLTNADLSMQETIFSEFPMIWDCLASAEEVKAYKPSPFLYLHAALKLGLAPEQIMMVAAHTFDLNAARELGFMTALVERSGEPGSSRLGLDHVPDVIVPDFYGLVDFFNSMG